MEESDHTLEQVIEDCKKDGHGFAYGMEWWNSTHFMNNNDCKIILKDTKISEPEPPHTANELDELCRTNQALCLSPIRSEIPVEDVCGPNMKFVDAICTPDCGKDEYLDGHCVEKPDNGFSTYVALFIFSMIPVWFAISGVYLAFGKKHRKLIPVILVIIGILWILGIYTNTLPVVFG